MQRDKLTTLMITHNMRDAIAHGNRLIMPLRRPDRGGYRGGGEEEADRGAALALFSKASGSTRPTTSCCCRSRWLPHRRWGGACAVQAFCRRQNLAAGGIHFRPRGMNQGPGWPGPAGAQRLGRGRRQAAAVVAAGFPIADGAAPAPCKRLPGQNLAAGEFTSARAGYPGSPAAWAGWGWRLRTRADDKLLLLSTAGFPIADGRRLRSCKRFAGGKAFAAGENHFCPRGRNPPQPAQAGWGTAAGRGRRQCCCRSRWLPHRRWGGAYAVQAFAGGKTLPRAEALPPARMKLSPAGLGRLGHSVPTGRDKLLLSQR